MQIPGCNWPFFHHFCGDVAARMVAHFISPRWLLAITLYSGSWDFQFSVADLFVGAFDAFIIYKARGSRLGDVEERA